MNVGPSIGVFSFRPMTATSSGASTAQRSAVQYKASEAVNSDAQSPPKRDDFSNMTSSEFLEAGKTLAKDGKISLDEMFQIQLASGTFGGAQPEPGSRDFVKYFSEQLHGEISRGGLNNPKSMVPIYRSLLSIMTDRTSHTA